MFLNFFFGLKSAGVPVSLREHLTLIEAVEAGIAQQDIETFYHLARMTLVKDERYIDRFDRVFATAFQGLEAVSGAAEVEARELPEEWLRKLAEKHLSKEEMEEVEALGGWDKLMETLQKRLEEQKGRHQGGSKWIGTGGTSPFGAYGYNPEGVRIGQKESRHRRAVKVWDRRDFKDYDDQRELGVRAIKIALRRLRRWARDSAHEELDLDGTIRESARQGYLDVKVRPERRNAIKVLLLMDVGGSMDDHVQVVEDLFSASRGVFKNLEFYYFHNCLYEGVWKTNRRRWDDQTKTVDLLQKYGRDWSVVFVGDAAMSPYEVMQPGGASEHFNAESGETWLRRAVETWPKTIWLNPTPEQQWRYTPSTQMIAKVFEERMYPTTLEGLESAMKQLAK